MDWEGQRLADAKKEQLALWVQCIQAGRDPSSIINISLDRDAHCVRDEAVPSFVYSSNLKWCPLCDRRYGKHPKHPRHGWLNVLCDGSIVKL
jgi:hypothetical protein